MTIHRRRMLLSGTALALGKLLPANRPALAQAPADASPTAPERTAMAALAARFMQDYDVPGLSVAIARHGTLAYEDAFGFADRDLGTRLTTAHRFRIASVSKPITSVAIFTLIERRELALDDHVFGPGSILGRDFGHVAAGNPLAQITIEHLLTHSGGGWANDGNDPMFRQPRLTQAELIDQTLKTQPLATQPGTRFAYSNFGYCILGRVIEKVARRPYAAYVRDVVLGRAGIEDMDIAGNTLADRHPMEVRYHGQGGEDPYGMNVHRMDSHGGWLARPAALALFAGAAAGDTSAALLTPQSIATMTTASATNANYAKGWLVNRYRNRWHDGSLPGTVAIMVRTHHRYSWAALINTRRSNSAISLDLDKLIWAMARQVPSWQV